MYSHPPQDNAKFAPQGYPMNIPPPRQLYHPPYISSANGGAAVGRRWSTGLCHCCDDPANCFVTCMCPCITFGQIAEIVNKGSISCAVSGTVYGVILGLSCLPCLYSCFYRSRLRGQYDLEEAPCVDCLVHYFCEPCALCQEYRELKSRGFDMGIGWQANMDRQSRGITVAPTTIGGMSRRIYNSIIATKGTSKKWQSKCSFSDRSIEVLEMITIWSIITSIN